MGGKVNLSQATRAIIDNVLNATGKVNVAQETGELPLAVSLTAGNNKIGKVESNYPIEGASVFLGLSVPANTPAGTWVNMNFWQEFPGASRLFLPIRFTALATPNTITADISIEYSHDQQVTRFYESAEILGTVANNEIAVSNPTKFWTFPVNNPNLFVGGISLSLLKKARYIRLRMRVSGVSSTTVTASVEAQPLYF
jgi:hypothetical protein